MPVGDFLGGSLLLALLLGMIGTASWLVARRRLAHLDRLERVLAHAVIATALLLAVHIVPMMLGVLARGSVLVAAAVALLAATRVPRAPRTEPDPPSVRGPRPASDPVSWAIAGAGALVAVTTALWQLKEYAGREVTGIDSLTFHLPNVARWIQTGSLWQQDEFLPDFALGTYPNNGDVLLLATVLPWHNEFLARWAMAAFLVLTGLAVYALARELRAPAAAGLLAALVVVTLPILGLSVIPRSLPDVVLYAMFAIGALFLARHARTDRRSDLVLAGVALGIAFGTKWYGVTSIPLLVAVWAGARLLARQPWRPVARDFGIVTALVTAAGGIWLVRNLVETGNPFYPQRLAPLGITVFDAPFDPLRAQIGFSIFNYKTQPDVLGDLVLEVVQGLGAGPFLVAAGVALALVLAWGRDRDRDRTVLVAAVAAALLGLLYVGTPYTAFGLKDHPSLADVNTRYAIPALVVGAAVTAWAIGRLPRVLAWAAQLAALAVVITSSRRAFDLATLKGSVAVAVGLAALLAAGYGLWRATDGGRRRRPLLAGVGAVAVLLALQQAHDSQKTLNDAGRYSGADAAIDRLAALAPAHRRIALAGRWTVDGQTPIYPAFGERLDNEVEYLGPYDQHTLRQYGASQRPAFLRALRGGDYDLLIVGRGLRPPARINAERWARGAGWRTVALSRRLRVLAPPQS
jgi:hypothetical protein